MGILLKKCKRWIFGTKPKKVLVLSVTSTCLTVDKYPLDTQNQIRSAVTNLIGKYLQIGVSVPPVWVRI